MKSYSNLRLLLVMLLLVYLLGCQTPAEKATIEESSEELEITGWQNDLQEIEQLDDEFFSDDPILEELVNLSLE